jgi:hypothetical protein
VVTQASPTEAPAWVERRAKLFEAGEYPDKGLTITTDHLDALVRNFARPVPVLVEHAESPLEMGMLRSVERVGTELFGQIALSAEAHALVERSGARALSLGLSTNLDQIREVSLVRNPRVPDARLFFVQEDAPKEAVDLDAYVRRGKLLPCQVPFAQALLGADSVIEFNGDRTPLRQVLIALLERQPPHSLFAELAPVPTTDHSAHLMLPEEADFYRRHFPDVSLDEIARRR